MDLDDQELKATRKLNGVDKENNIEKDIKIVKSLIENTKESLISNTKLNQNRKTNRIIAYKATEHLLSEYTRQKQEKEQYKQMYLDEVDKHVDIILLYNSLLNKIKNKIKETQKEENLYAKNNIIKILQELLPMEDK